MRCYLCTAPILPGQRTTFLLLSNSDGSPGPEYVMHEGCKDEMVRRTSGLAGIAEVDLDDVG